MPRVTAIFVLVLAASPASFAAAEPPSRIVSLAPGVTETLFALGAGESVVGATQYCDYPEAAKEIPRVGSYLAPNVESVIAARPDLLIAVPTPGNRDAVLSIEGLGVETLVVEEGPTVDSVLDSITRIGRAVDRVSEARELVGRIRQRLDAVERRVAGLDRPDVLVVLDRNPFVVAGGGTLLQEILEIAGGRNVAAGFGEWPRLSVEAVIRADPDVILDNAMGASDRPDVDRYVELGLRAAKTGRVLAVELDEILRPGPRLAEGAERLAELLHPGGGTSESGAP